MSVAVLSPNGQTTTSGVGPATTLLVATIQGLLIYEREAQGKPWALARRALVEFQISSVLHDPVSGRILAGTHGGKGLWASDDGGATWSQKTGGMDRPHVYMLVAQPRPEGTVIYCGTEPVGLYRSTDMGETWTDLPAVSDVPGNDRWTFPPPPHIAHVKHIAFHPAEPKTLYVCIEQGALLKSVDDGASWVELTDYENVALVEEKFRRDNHRVVIRPSNPQHLLLCGGEGLFRSLDGGITWEHLLTRQSRVGYPDAMFLDPRDENTVYLGGPGHAPREWAKERNADATVMVSHDFGTTWQERREGLPNPVVGNIEAMGLHQQGEQVLISVGTATGEVYVSENEGHHWERVAHNVPPISKAGHFRWFLTDERRLQIEEAMRGWKPAETV